MVTTKKKTSEILPETESVTPTPTYQDVYAAGTTGAASPTRVGNRQYANNTGPEVVPEGGEGPVDESGGGGTVSPTPMTYEQWRTAQRNKINQDTQAAKDLANIGYYKSLSEYGSNAAALESMGLTGSGYSNYLNSQAYAQRQSAYANADAQRAQSMFDLDTKYMEYLDQQEREEKQRQDTINSNFVTAMGSITADTTDTEIEQMAALGFSEPQIESLKTQRNSLKQQRTDAETKAATEKQKTAYQTILGMIKYDTPDEVIKQWAASLGLDATDSDGNDSAYITDAIKYRNALADESDKLKYIDILGNLTYETTEAWIDELAKAYGWITTDENGVETSNDYVNALKAARLNRIKEYLATLDPSEIDKETLDALFPNGADDTNYGSIYTEYLSKVKENSGGTVDFLVDGKLISENEARAALAAIKDVADPEVYAELEKEYNNLYTPVTIGAKLGTDVGGRLRVDKTGDNFEVKYTNSDGTVHTYNVQNGGKVGKDDKDSAVLSFITNGQIGDGEVFKWNGALYLRVGSNIIRVERRATNAHRWTGGQGYNSLFNLF